MSKWLTAFQEAPDPEYLTAPKKLTAQASEDNSADLGGENTSDSLSMPVQLGLKGADRSAPPSSLPPADKLGATWGHEVAALIRWFLAAKVPAERFELQPGVVIANPARWWPTIAADIKGGPRRARGLTGALAADLRRLHERFGQAASTRAAG